MHLPVFDIIRGSCLDGPGIRTVIFLQGCPLRCIWCHNPESQDRQRNVRPYSAAELLEIILRDRSYYRASGGGVTFSGGEPLLHMRSLQELAYMLWEQQIPVAFDTSGLFDFDEFKELLLPYTTDMLYDLKIIDCFLHKSLTGVSNEIILRNLELLTKTGVSIRIRIPLVPGVTATKKNLDAIAKKMRELELHAFDVIPYNPSCIDKLKKMGFEPSSLLELTPMSLDEERACGRRVLDSLLTPCG